MFVRTEIFDQEREGGEASERGTEAAAARLGGARDTRPRIRRGKESESLAGIVGRGQRRLP